MGSFAIRRFLPSRQMSLSARQFKWKGFDMTIRARNRAHRFGHVRDQKSVHIESGTIQFKEARGVREKSVLFLFSDISETLSGFPYNGYEALKRHATLRKMANLWLKLTGEQLTHDSEMGERGAAFKIAKEYGFLSRTGIAAEWTNRDSSREV